MSRTYKYFLPGIKPQFYKVPCKFPTVIFPEKVPREHWIFAALFPYRFSVYHLPKIPAPQQFSSKAAIEP